MVAQGVGQRGTALEYLTSTIEHIDVLGISDPQLHDVFEMAKALQNT